MEILDYRKISNFFKALSHPTRVSIIAKILEGERCVNDIKEFVGARQANISQHLTILKLSGIVDWRQEGKKKCYFLKNPGLVKGILSLFREDNIYGFGR